MSSKTPCDTRNNRRRPHVDQKPSGTAHHTYPTVVESCRLHCWPETKPPFLLLLYHYYFSTREGSNFHVTHTAVPTYQAPGITNRKGRRSSWTSASNTNEATCLHVWPVPSPYARDHGEVGSRCRKGKGWHARRPSRRHDRE